MVRVIWIIAARSAAIDMHTNILSIFELIEEIQMPHPPPEFPTPFVVPIPFVIIAQVHRETTDSRLLQHRLQIVAPDNAVLFAFDGVVDFGEGIRTRLRMNMQGWPVARPGTYTYRLSTRNAESEPWVEANSNTVQVMFQPLLGG